MLLTIGVTANDLSKSSTWLESNQHTYPSDDAKEKGIGIVYSNEGGYIVDAVKVKIKRHRDKAIIYSNRHKKILLGI